jgi:replicative DNA helicase Mcm
VSVNKASIHATLICETTILAAANPKYGIYDRFQPIFSQLNLPPALVSRFDLIFPFTSHTLTSEDYRAIVNKMMSRWRPDHQESINENNLMLVKKYISLAKRLNPTVPLEVEARICSHFDMVRERANMTESNKIPVSPRQIDALRRLGQARARAHLREYVTEEDVDYAFGILSYSLTKIGISEGKKAGEFNLATLESGVRVSTKTVLKDRIIGFISKKQELDQTGVDEYEVWEEFKQDFGDSRTAFDDFLQKLNSVGDILSGKAGKWKTR